ncbi:MAG: polyketide synthase dehydratase domain-containing protein, partial [Gemmatimonadaceae bacterium]
MPTYPWQRERFWKKLTAGEHRAKTQATRRQHPLLGGRVAGPLPVFETELGVATPPFLNDHRILGRPLFPAAGYLELALAAAHEVMGDAPVELRDISLREALWLPEDGTATVQVILTPEADQAQTVHVFSRRQMTADTDAQAWHLHASGRIIAERSSPLPTRASDSLAEARARCTTAVDVADYYGSLRKFSAEYGPAFRGIVQLSQAQGEALAQISLPENLRIAGSAYCLHPALLDACLQLAVAAKDFAKTPDQHCDLVYLPIGIGRVRVYQHGLTDVWCHFSVPGDVVPGQAMISCSVTLFDSSGALVATLDDLSLRRLSRASMRASLLDVQLSDGLYQLAWRAKAASKTEEVAAGRWLLLSDEPGSSAALADVLRTAGHAADLVHLGNKFSVFPHQCEIDPAVDAHAEQLVHAVFSEEVPVRGFVVVWPYATLPDEPTLAALDLAQSTVVRATLSLAKALEATGIPMWLVTRGSQAFSGAVPDVAQAPLWGLGGVIAAENPRLSCVRIDLDPQSDPRDVQALANAILRPDDEPSIAFRDGVRYVARLESAELASHEGENALRLETRDRGQLENLQLVHVTRLAPAHDEVEIEVRAAGLNFRDVLNALGAYPGNPGALGNECAGVVTAVGSDVTDLRVGDEVISVPQGGMATYVLAPAALTVRKPASLTFAEAATIPVTFLTAQYALHDLGKMQSGDRVLIHAATGGVGMAAMQLARAAGATIVATAGSESKRALAKTRGAHIAADSRSHNFGDAVLEATNGEGVDIVLNSLAGEFIPKSLQLLRAGGRFIELGKTDVWDDGRVAAEYPGVSYHMFFLGELAMRERQRLRTLLESLLEDFASGALRPLPMHVFPLARAEDAFRFMAQAKHRGKVVLTPHVDAVIRADATYLITGGLTGLGLAIAKALAAQGARHLVLAGRRPPSDGARAVIDSL